MSKTSLYLLAILLVAAAALQGSCDFEGALCKDDPDNLNCTLTADVAVTPRMAKSTATTFYVRLTNQDPVRPLDETLSLQIIFSQPAVLPGLPMVPDSPPLSQSGATTVDPKTKIAYAKFEIPKGYLDAFRPGQLSLKVKTIANRLAAEVKTRLYVTPNFGSSMNFTIGMPANIQEIGPVFYQAASHLLFVAERYGSAGMYSAMSRHNFDGSCPPTGCSVFQGRNKSGMSALAQDAALIYETNSALLWSYDPTQTDTNRPSQTINSAVSMIAASPEGSNFALADATKVYISPYDSLKSCTGLANGFSMAMQYIQAEETSRAIVLSGTAKPYDVFICEKNKMSVPSKNEPLAACIKKQIADLAFNLTAKVAISTGDVDRDGVPDLVIVPTGSTDHFYYLPYAEHGDVAQGASDCAFWPIQKVALPSSITDIQSIAIGTIDGDELTDVALTVAGSTALTVLSGSVPPAG